MAQFPKAASTKTNVVDIQISPYLIQGKKKGQILDAHVKSSLCLSSNHEIQSTERMPKGNVFITLSKSSDLTPRRINILLIYRNYKHSSVALCKSGGRVKMFKTHKSYCIKHL